jgi:2,3-bisphosphoglycerate-dependent phosphoglycerate mutase
MPRDFQRPFTLPKGATEVILVRHGSSGSQSPGRPAGLIDGDADPPLSARGQRQALAVAGRLGDERVAGLFVTPLRRTAETAQPLSARLGRDPIVIEELREVFLGDWEHDFRVRIAGRDPLSADVFAAERWDVIPNAEDMDSFGARVGAGMERVAALAGPDATAIAVVHGGVIAEACRQATGSTAFAFLYAENGSISRVMRLASGRWTLRSFNDISHLAAISDSHVVAEGQTRLIGGELG